MVSSVFLTPNLILQSLNESILGKSPSREQPCTTWRIHESHTNFNTFQLKILNMFIPPGYLTLSFLCQTCLHSIVYFLSSRQIGYTEQSEASFPCPFPIKSFHVTTTHTQHSTLGTTQPTWLPGIVPCVLSKGPDFNYLINLHRTRLITKQLPQLLCLKATHS